MHMGELVLYHEKDDISCLFNNYQHPIPPDQEPQPDPEPPAEAEESQEDILSMSQ